MRAHEPTNAFQMDDGREVAVWCSDPQTTEVEEGDGWTTVYEGRTCHDVRTGVLVWLSYVKKWLFTGEYNGQTYDRASFGDYESLEQHLVDINADLQYIE
jgi:hypothetical protein